MLKRRSRRKQKSESKDIELNEQNEVSNVSQDNNEYITVSTGSLSGRASFNQVIAQPSFQNKKSNCCKKLICFSLIICILLGSILLLGFDYKFSLMFETKENEQTQVNKIIIQQTPSSDNQKKSNLNNQISSGKQNIQDKPINKNPVQSKIENEKPTNAQNQNQKSAKKQNQNVNINQEQNQKAKINKKQNQNKSQQSVIPSPQDQSKNDQNKNKQQTTIKQEKAIDQSKKQQQKNEKQNPNQPSPVEAPPQPKQKFRVRQKFRQRTPVSVPGRDRYQFTKSIQSIVDTSPVRYMFNSPDAQWSGIKRSQYQRAIRLMEVVHNVNIDGQFIFDHFNFYQSAQQKYKAFQKILLEQKLFYDQKYQINKYWNDQIGICVYIPSYNNAQNSRLYLRALDSVFQQDYKNYHVVFVNDFSTDKTGQYAQAYMEVNKIPQEKYLIINNQKRKLNSENSYIVGNQHCNLGQIMIMLDGDDALVGRQVFSLLNAIYQKQKIALSYGQFLLTSGNSVSSGYSTMDIPQYALQQGTYRKLGMFYASHLKTMYVDVFRQIKITDFQYPNGTFLDYATDVIFMTPGIQLVGTRLKFIKEIIYEYNYNTGLNQPAHQQKRVQLLIYTKPPYKKMENMDFADNPKTIHYP